jgi:hypothetical protein
LKPDSFGTTYNQVAGPGTPNAGNTWAAIKVFLDDLAHACADNVIAEWGGVLAGVDILAFDHCWSIQTEMRVD